MKYVLIGSLLGSLIHSEHDTREACEGRAVLLREAKAAVQCVEMPPRSGSFTTGISNPTRFCYSGAGVASPC